MDGALDHSCLQCSERPDRFFCDLPAEAGKAFDALKSTVECPRGTILFYEGSPAKEIYVLCEGRARVSICSESGDRLTLRVAGPGEILGLSACLSGSDHQVRAELLDSARVAVVKRHDLTVFLHDHREACMQIVGLLSQDLHRAYDRVRSVGMGRGRRSKSIRVH